MAVKTKSMSTKKAPVKKATVKKVASKKAPIKSKSAVKTVSKKKAPAKKKAAVKRIFPKKQLNAFLRKNSQWDHSVWAELLAELKELGFTDLTDSAEGRDAIGLYLETNRN